MGRSRRPDLAAEARRRNLEQVARLGAEVRVSRQRRRWTQGELGTRAGVSRASVSRIERGMGGGQTLDTRQRVALAAGAPLVVKLQRDPLQDTLDAGHLALQELVLRLGRRAGYERSFELATRPSEPWRSTDVVLRDDRWRLLVLVECWNTFGDVGAAARATARKVAEATGFGAGFGGDRPYQVRSCWVVRASRRNRALIARYPEVFASRFPGSSARWAAALGSGAQPPPDPGLVWADVTASRLLAWRRRTPLIEA